ncbi:MAG: excinuclease ABC subunit UvrC [Candidatus Lokiarchaeota archaeon]|nr:excinuclease ABC subunit UvrC [Candidatus Lokiarchaeota archaeon]
MNSSGNLDQLVNGIPDSPGVYMWKDATETILYIGKAKSLRKRVRSYLRTRSLDRKTWEMMNRAEDIETILTNTEREALLLEATMIKKHKPRYNIALKDDRRHAWIRVDLDAEIPALQVTRDAKRDGARYFGPFGSTRRLERLLDTLRRFIPVAMCNDPDAVNRECMDYHLERCTGPCMGNIKREDYLSLVEDMCMYLDGKGDELRKLLKERMQKAAQELQFEKAATIRDRIDDLDIVMRRQKVVQTDGINRDVLGVSRTEHAALVEILLVRNGRLVGHDNFFFEVELDTTDNEVLQAFVEQFYFSSPEVPEEIIMPVAIEKRKELGKWLSETERHPVRIGLPDTEKTKELIHMANMNAKRALRRILILDQREEEVVNEGVRELRNTLNLRHAPFHIEGFDIANIQGSDATGSCVVFKNGQPENSSYRHFRIRSIDTPDDYAMMREVVSRRYRSMLEHSNELPDLILIDGGKGQLGAAVEALSEVGLEYLKVAALAKRDEILYTRDRPDGIAFQKDSPALRLVQQVRDEAHRFAQRYYHKLREKRFTGSILEEAPGIGPKRRSALLRAFGSYQEIREASVDALADVQGISSRLAKSLREWLDREG